MSDSVTKNDNNSVTTHTKSPGVLKREKNLVSFTPMTARQAQEASVKARNIRKQVRADILNKLVSNLDFGNEMLKAVKSGDAKRVELLEKALSIVGLRYADSEDAVNKLHIDATTDNKVAGQVEFVLPGTK